MSEEGLRTTPNRLIHIGNPIPFDADTFLQQLQQLMRAACDGQDAVVQALVEEMVCTYCPAGAHGSKAKGEACRQQRAAN